MTIEDAPAEHQHPADAPAAVLFEAARRPVARRAAVIGLALALCAALAATGSLVVRPALAPRLVQRVAAAYVFPGAAPALPWPKAGQAALEVAGIGPLGSSGPADAPVPIASVAKVLTAYQILRDHPLALDAQGPEITVLPEEAAAYGAQAAANESLIPVDPDEQLTERQALDALMLASADNVAQILGRWDAGSVSVFTARLNRTAAGLGMAHSTYTDPSGLDPATVSTAADQLRLAAAAMAVPAFAAIVGQRNADIPLAGAIHNFNRLLGTDGVVGVKTGSTGAAGGCLMFAADVPISVDAPSAAASTSAAAQTHAQAQVQARVPDSGSASTSAPALAAAPLRIYGVVLGQPGSAGTILPNALAAARRLVEAGAATLGTATAVAAGQPVADLHRPLRSDRSLSPAADVQVLGWPGLRYTVRVGGTAANPVLTVTQLGAPGNQVVSPLS